MEHKQRGHMINNFTELANRFHPSIRFTAEISHTEITFMETCLYKGDRLKKNSSIDVRTHFKPTETFQYTPFDSCHPPGVRKGFIKGEALRFLRINSWKAKFVEHMALFKQRLQHRVIQITFWTWPYLKSISAKEYGLYKINKKRAKECCRLLQNTAHQCLISNIFLWTNAIWYKTDPHYEKYSKFISCRKGRSVKYVRVRAKLRGLWTSYPVVFGLSSPCDISEETKVKTHLAKLVFNCVSSLSKIQKIYTSTHDNFVTASLLLLLTTRKWSLDG